MDRVKEPQSVTIRQPATANLMVDSADRVTPTQPPWEFLIARNASLMNGFFHRIGATEVVLEWFQGNVSNSLFDNAAFLVNVTGAPANPYLVTLPDGFYTVAGALQSIAALLNSTSAGGITTWAAAASPGGAILTTGNATTFTVEASILATSLGFNIAAAAAVSQFADAAMANLRVLRYIDFTSPQLTYCQDLKDAATQNQDQNVLCRWYMDYDVPPPADAFGFPILMGYQPFTLRRPYNPPKQIRWDSFQPIGQLGFKLYGYCDTLPVNAVQPYLPMTQIYPTAKPFTNWLMTLQVSEN